MWRRLAIVWAVMAAAVFIFYGAEHITIFSAPDAGPAVQAAAEDAQSYILFPVEVVLLVVLAICIWLNIRIIRRYRKTG